MTRDQPPGGNHRVGETADPLTPDAAILEMVRLLSVVEGEEQALARLDRCVAELRGIAAARAALAGCTGTELTEAQTWARRSDRSSVAPMLPVRGTEGSW